MKIDLNDQVILITGASRGIGQAIANLFAENEARLALQYHQHAEAAEIIASRCRHGIAIKADLGQTSNCQYLIDQTLNEFGRVDVLINNAGVAIPENPTGRLESWLAAWENTLNVNLLGAATLSKLVLPGMIAQGGGRMIHIASRAAFRGDTPDYMAYAASKAGLVALSRSLARGYGKKGIKSFVVAPGFTRTDMAQQFIDEYGEDYALNDIALDRLTLPRDIAPTVLFLASGQMDHATGCAIDINAGSYVR